MKFLITSDWRLTDEDDQCFRLERQIINLVAFARKYSPDIILHAGNILGNLQVCAMIAAKGNLRLLQTYGKRAFLIQGHKSNLGEESGFRDVATYNGHPRLDETENATIFALPPPAFKSSAAIDLMMDHARDDDFPVLPKIILAHAVPYQANTGVNKDIPDWYWDSSWSRGWDLTVCGGICKPQIVSEDPLILVPGSPTWTRKPEIMDHYGEKIDEPRGVWTWEPGSLPKFHELYPIKRTPINGKQAAAELFDF